MEHNVTGLDPSKPVTEYDEKVLSTHKSSLGNDFPFLTTECSKTMAKPPVITQVSGLLPAHSSD